MTLSNVTDKFWKMIRPLPTNRANVKYKITVYRKKKGSHKNNYKIFQKFMKGSSKTKCMAILTEFS